MPMFHPHKLNERGQRLVTQAHKVMERTLDDLEALYPSGSREAAIVRTKLQEASMFAARAVAMDCENHDCAGHEAKED